MKDATVLIGNNYQPRADVIANAFSKIFAAKPPIGDLEVKTASCTKTLTSINISKKVIHGKLSNGKFPEPENIIVSLLKNCVDTFPKILSILFT